LPTKTLYAFTSHRCFCPAHFILLDSIFFMLTLVSSFGSKMFDPLILHWNLTTLSYGTYWNGRTPAVVKILAVVYVKCKQWPGTSTKTASSRRICCRWFWLAVEHWERPRSVSVCLSAQ
jgi:hypothetical protein